jgi:DNA-binding XRE family transcriptional regulator
MIEDLKKLLKDHGIMKSFAAKKIGVVPATITSWFSKKSTPSLKQEKSIKSYLAKYAQIMQDSEK